MDTPWITYCDNIFILLSLLMAFRIERGGTVYIFGSAFYSAFLLEYLHFVRKTGGRRLRSVKFLAFYVLLSVTQIAVHLLHDRRDHPHFDIDWEWMLLFSFIFVAIVCRFLRGFFLPKQKRNYANAIYICLVIYSVLVGIEIFFDRPFHRRYCSFYHGNDFPLPCSNGTTTLHCLRYSSCPIIVPST